MARTAIPVAVRAAVYERDGHACRRCGATAKLSIDHITSVVDGGTNEEANLQTLCGPCNSMKGTQARTPRLFSALPHKNADDPLRTARLDEYGRGMDDALKLGELRQWRNVRQTDVAATTGVTQPRVAQIEGSEDLYLSTLRGYVEALGGELQLIAHLPIGPVRIAIPKA